MPAAKKKPARKLAARARRARPKFHLPTLEQRHLHLIGLGLVRARRTREPLRECILHNDR